MKGRGVMIVLAIAVIAVFAIIFSGVLPHSGSAPITGFSQSQTAEFQGHMLQLPAPWREYLPGSRGNFLNMKKPDGGRAGSTLTLQDERHKPEEPNSFVSGWIQALKVNPGLHPDDVSEYHDSAVDGAGMRCVAMRWTDKRRPLQLVCLASNGLWKLTLIGSDSDVSALDALAQQMSEFQRGL